MTTRVGKSYEYNGICDRCGFKKKSYEVDKTWDGYWVCKDTCWEPRHILDFYKTRSDTHTLPFIRDDNANPLDMGVSQGLNWTVVLGTGTVTLQGTYVLNPDTRILTYQIQTIITGNATVSSTAGRYTATSTTSYPIIAGSCSSRTVSNNGSLLASANGLSILQAGAFAAQNTSFTTSGSYSY